MEELKRYPWPGNVRELKNLIERAMIICSNRTLNLHPPHTTFSEIPEDHNLEDAERRHILGVLQQTGWRVSGQGGAAGILGIKRTTLQSKMKKLGIRRSPE
jgi:transcriptional regulator of acetoin/glycerol metabolism